MYIYIYVYILQEKSIYIYIYIYMYINRAIDLMSRAFANAPADRGSIASYEMLKK